MLEKHEDLILCDLAEYYNIYNYENFEPLYIATLVCGLRGSSRLMQELTGIKHTEAEIVQAKMCDLLSLIWWSKTKDGQNNRNRPSMMTEKMLNVEKEEKQDFSHDVFSSVEEFEKARLKSLGG